MIQLQKANKAKADWKAFMDDSNRVVIKVPDPVHVVVPKKESKPDPKKQPAKK